MNKSNSAISHVEKYVGAYAKTDDFAFQEQLRRSDLAIKIIVKEALGNSKADSFFINGWGQVISAAYLLEKNPSQLRVSEAFSEFLIGGLNKAISKATEENNPFAKLNVRGFTKTIMMQPTHPTKAGKYFDWETIEIEKPVMDLNQFVKEADLNFSLCEGKLFLKINPEDESNIFNQLWKTDFAQLLEENGYEGFEKNKECPHVTLVNSNEIAKVNEQFNKKYGNEEGLVQFNLFFERLLTSLNEGLKKQINPVEFTKLDSVYSADYSPFEEVIVAKFKAPYLENAMNILLDEVENELGIKIFVQKTSFFHLTIATKYRQPSVDLKKDINIILNETGEYAESLRDYWQQFAIVNK